VPWPAGKLALVKLCRGILDSAEKRIGQLTETKEGVKAEALDAKEIVDNK
jgi:exonuclease VII small subunit